MSAVTRTYNARERWQTLQGLNRVALHRAGATAIITARTLVRTARFNAEVYPETFGQPAGNNYRGIFVVDCADRPRSVILTTWAVSEEQARRHFVEVFDFEGWPAPSVESIKHLDLPTSLCLNTRTSRDADNRVTIEQCRVPAYRHGRSCEWQ